MKNEKKLQLELESLSMDVFQRVSSKLSKYHKFLFMSWESGDEYLEYIYL